jgi:Fic family protein
MDTSKYARIARCSGNTSPRHIGQLVARKILIPNEADGRNTRFRLNWSP